MFYAILKSLSQVKMLKKNNLKKILKLYKRSFIQSFRLSFIYTIE